MFLKTKIGAVIGVSALILSGCITIPPYASKDPDGYFKGQSFPISHYAQTHERDIHYVTKRTPEDRPTIAFVHGTPGAWEAYAKYLGDTDLQEKANMLSVDRLGFGESGAGEPELSLAKQGDAVMAAVFRETDGPVYLVGHSLGGPIVARMAMDYPDKVAGVIMIAPAIDPAQEEKRRWYNEAASWRVVSAFLPTSWNTANKEIIIQKKAELDEMLPLWEKIKTPVVVIQGTKDKLVPAANADFAARVLKDHNPPKIVMLKGGHFIIWQDYDMIKSELISLLEK